MMFPLLLLIYIRIALSNAVNATMGNWSLPSGSFQASIGYNSASNQIWLLGSFYDSWSINISRLPEFNALTIQPDLRYRIASPDGQAYAQKDDILYVLQHITASDGQFMTFNMSSGNVSKFKTDPNITLSDAGCLSVIDDYLIWVDGSFMYILNLSTRIWSLQDNPQLLQTKSEPACVVEPDSGYLYVIGGLYCHTKIQKLYVKDMLNVNKYNFTYLTDELHHCRANTRAIVYKTDIYVIGGGYTGPSSEYLKEIELIDTTTDSITLFGYLAQGVFGATPMAVEFDSFTAIYVFGGWAESGIINKWQYFYVFSALFVRQIHF